VAGIHRDDDTGDMLHRNRDVTGLDVCRLLRLSRLMAIAGRDDRYSMCDSITLMGSRSAPPGGGIGGLEPTGKGGCRELSIVP